MILNTRVCKLKMEPQKEQLSNKKKPGRKSMAEDEKKQNLTITIEHSTMQRLVELDKKNFRKFLARYIDKNIDEILEQMKNF